MSARTDEIIIDDVARSQKYSLYEIEGRLGSKDGADYGEFEECAEFEDACLIYNDLSFKLKSSGWSMK